MPKRKLTPLILWIKKAKLVKWTKGFSCSDVEGHDVVDQLQQAIQRRKDVQIEVCAILNDTTGCLMSSAWRDNRCRIGLILGTGMTKKIFFKKRIFWISIKIFYFFLWQMSAAKLIGWKWFCKNNFCTSICVENKRHFCSVAFLAKWSLYRLWMHFPFIYFNVDLF